MRRSFADYFWLWRGRRAEYGLQRHEQLPSPREDTAPGASRHRPRHLEALTADSPSLLGTVDVVTRYLFEQRCYVTEHPLVSTTAWRNASSSAWSSAPATVSTKPPSAPDWPNCTVRAYRADRAGLPQPGGDHGFRCCVTVE